MKAEILVAGKLMNPFIVEEEKIAILRSLNRSAISQEIYDQLIPQGLLPYFVDCIDQIGQSKIVSPAMRRRARVLYLRSWKEFEARKSILIRILDVAQKYSIPVLVLKGWALVDKLYAGNAGHRPFNDIDIAVRRYDSHKMKALLESFGGVVTIRNVLMARETIQIDDISVEVHTSLTTHNPHDNSYGNAVKDENVWIRAKRHEFAGRTALVYSQEDMICALAEHMIVLDDMERKPLRHAVELTCALAQYKHLGIGNSIEAVARSRGYPSAWSGAVMAARLIMGEIGIEYVSISCSTSIRRAVTERLQIGHAPHWETVPRGKLKQALKLAQWNALFTDTFANRLRLTRHWMFPNRAYVGHILGKKLSLHEYVAYLLVHPVVLSLLVPALIVLWTRQFESVLLSFREIYLGFHKRT